MVVKDSGIENGKDYGIAPTLGSEASGYQTGPSDVRYTGWWDARHARTILENGRILAVDSFNAWPASPGNLTLTVLAGCGSIDDNWKRNETASPALSELYWSLHPRFFFFLRIRGVKISAG